MKDKNKSREELVAELSELRQRLADMERQETEDKGAEEKSREGELRYRTIADSTYDFEFWLSPEGQFLYASPSCKRIYGRDPAEFLADPTLRRNMIHPEDRASFDRHLADTEAKQITGRVEFRVVRPDGSLCWIGHACQPVFGEGGEWLGVRGSNRDITDRKRAEQALSESERRLRQMTDNLPVVVYQITAEPDGGRRFRYVSDGVEQLNEITAAEVLSDAGKIYGQMLLEYLAVVKEREEEALTNLTTMRVEVLSRLPSGRLRWFEYTSTPRRGTDGLWVWYGIEVDITERKRAEEALRDRAEELATLLDSIPTPVFIAHDPDCLSITGNRAADDLLHNPRGGEASLGAPSENKPRHFKAFKDGHELSIDELPAQQAARGSQVEEFEFSLVFDDGTTRQVVGYGTPLWDEQGQPRGSVLVLVDITERKRMEEELSRSRHELELRVHERTAELAEAYGKLKEESKERDRVEAQLRQAHKMEALGTFAGGIAHDFNNILAAIIGFCELARDKTPEASPAHRHLDRVYTAGLRGRDLVRQILAFSRQTGQELKALQLESLVQETVKLLRASIPTTIEIRVNAKDSSHFVLADPIQMQQVLMNLCANAAHAMSKSGGIITIDVGSISFSSPMDVPDPALDPGHYVKLSVADTGEGMTAEVAGRIFDPFFTTKKPAEGTGLGLPVSHGIVANHGGAITVWSEPGRGSIFTVHLPEYTGYESLTSGKHDAEIPHGHERVLFIEDEEPLAQVGGEMLTKLGYTVTCKTSSREALALIRLDSHRFDLVITDQTMPEMTGLQLVKELRIIRPELPVILCTGFSNQVDAESAKQAGISAFVMKPLTKKEIANTIREVLDG